MRLTFTDVSKHLCFEQEQDCCGPNESTRQELVVETCDGGGGPYVVISTNRWAIDPNDKKEVQQFINALKDAVKGAGSFSHAEDKA